jgi:hypothetical protein
MNGARALISERRSVWTRGRFDRAATLGAFERVRVELVRGELVDRSPLSVAHANLIEVLSELLVGPLAGRARIRVQLPLIVDGQTELVPDLAVLPRRASRADHPSTASLVIEVSDTSARFDRVVKGPLYAAAGVVEFWLLDASRSQVEVFSSPGPRGYARHVKVTKGALAVPGFDDVTLDLAAVFGRR